MKEPERRIGSIAGIAYGATLLLALVLITPPFLGGPPDTLDPSNAEARVRLIAGLSATNIALLRIGFPLEFLNVPLLIVAFVALYRGLAQGKRFFALVALTSAVSSAAFLLIGHFQRFLVLDLGQRYGAADAVHKAGLGAVAVLGENLTQSADMAFNVLLGTGLVFFALAMRSSSFPRWLRIWTWVAAGFSLASALLSAIDWRLGFVSLPALVVFAGWTLALGFVLRRLAPPGDRDDLEARVR